MYLQFVDRVLSHFTLSLFVVGLFKLTEEVRHLLMVFPQYRHGLRHPNACCGSRLLLAARFLHWSSCRGFQRFGLCLAPRPRGFSGGGGAAPRTPACCCCAAMLAESGTRSRRMPLAAQGL